MMKKYLCTVSMLFCLILYNFTGDHTCCLIVWPMCSPAYKAQKYSPPAGTIILPCALWHFPPLSFHSTALTHNSLAYLCSNSRTPCWTIPLKTENFGASNIPCSNSCRQPPFTAELPHFTAADLWLFLQYHSWIALSNTPLEINRMAYPLCRQRRYPPLSQVRAALHNNTLTHKWRNRHVHYRSVW